MTMPKLIKNKNDIQYGINKLIERQLYLRDIINKKSAYTEDETIERLKMIQEDRIIRNTLYLLDIQQFEIKDDFDGLEIE